MAIAAVTYLVHGAEKVWDHRDEALEFVEGLKSYIDYPPLPPSLSHYLPHYCDAAKTTISDFGHSDFFGHIVNVWCCQGQNKVKHEFILVEVVQPGGRMWVRLERAFFRSSMLSKLHMTGLYTPNFEAKDTAAVASSHECLAHEEYRIMEHLPFNYLPMEKLKYLLRIFHSKAPDYTATKHNCWSFCLILIDCLRSYSAVQRPIPLRRPSLDYKLRQDIKTQFESGA